MRKRALRHTARDWQESRLSCSLDVILSSFWLETWVLVCSSLGCHQLWGPRHSAFPPGSLGFLSAWERSISRLPPSVYPWQGASRKLPPPWAWWCSPMKLHDQICAVPGFKSCCHHPDVLKRSTSQRCSPSPASYSGLFISCGNWQHSSGP